MSTKTVKLREILEVQNGFAFKTEFFNEADGLPLIRIRDLGTDSTKTHYSGEYRDEFIVAPGDYLIGMDGNFRCRRWAGPKALLNQRVCRLRNFMPEVLPEYLFFGIQPKLDAIEASTAFATVKHISAKQILDIELPLPPISEQRRIVDLLSRAEGIVRLRREAEKKAAELIPALFLNMFGDPAMNPKGWKTARFTDVVADIRNGFNPTKDQFGEGVQFITVNDLYNGVTIDVSASQQISVDMAAISKYQLRRGDLCFVRSSVKRAGVGMASIFDSDDEAVFGGFVIRARLSNEVLPMYTCAMFHVPSLRKIVVESAGTGTITNINQPALLNIPIIVPPLELQEEFSAKVDQAVSIQSQQSMATAKAQATFNALLAQTFSDRDRAV